MRISQAVKGLNPAGQYAVCSHIEELRDFTPPREYFYTDILKLTYDSPIFVERLPVSVMPIYENFALLARFYNVCIRMVSQFRLQSEPFAICMPSVSGKTTLSKRLGRHLQDIDTLLNDSEREYMNTLVSKALETQEWTFVNNFWADRIRLKARKDKILLAHAPEQLPPEYRWVIINTPLQPYIDKIQDPTRRRVAPMNRAALARYKDDENYHFVHRPHLVYKLVSSLIINPDISPKVAKPRYWYYAMRSLQTMWLLEHHHPLQHDTHRLTKYHTVSYETYLANTRYAEDFADQPILSYFIPQRLYSAMRSRPAPFDITLGCYSDGFIMYRKNNPAPVHFYKFFVRHFAYTLGFSATLLKSISSIFKKHNHWITPTWRYYIDAHMLLPPFPEPRTGDYFAEQLTTWFSREWKHEWQGNTVTFKSFWETASRQVNSTFKINPDPKVHSLIGTLLDNIPSIGTSGSAPLIRKTHMTPFGSMKLRRNKNTLLTQFSEEKILSSVLNTLRYPINVATKHETGGRNRLIAAAPVEKYLQDSALMEPLDPCLNTQLTNLYMSSEQALIQRVNRCRLTDSTLSNPLDLKSCEAQQNQFILQNTLHCLFKLAANALPNASDLQLVTDKILSSYSAGGIVKYHDFYTENIQGNPSGIRLTQVFNTFYNLTCQYFANNRLIDLGFTPLTSNFGVGDDADSAATDITSIILTKILYNVFNSKVALKTDWIGVLTTEFLRYVYTPQGYFGYPFRIVRALNFSNPYHNLTFLEPAEELEARVSTFITYYSRSLISFPFHDLYYDLRQLFLNFNIISFTVHDCFSLLHTPRSMGGLGVLPFFPSHNVYKYTFPRKMHFQMTKPPPITYDYPSHYIRFFERVEEKTGHRYRPSQTFNSTYFLDYRPKMKEIKFSRNSYSDYNKLTFVDDHDLLEIAKHYMSTLTPTQPAAHFFLKSEFSGSPFWADIYAQFSRRRIADTLFPLSDKFYRYKEMFRGSDLRTILEHGIQYPVVLLPQLSNQFVNGMSQSLTHYIFDKYLSSPIYSTTSFLPKLNLTVELFLNTYIPELINSAPFYHSH